MDINQNSSGMMNGIPPVGQKERKIGPIIGALIVIIILIVASLYFFGKKLNTETSAPVEEVPAVETVQTSSETPLSDSTETNALEADLNAQLNDVDYSF